MTNNEASNTASKILQREVGLEEKGIEKGLELIQALGLSPIYTTYIFVMYVCVCLYPSWQKDYRAKGLCMRGTREVSQRSGVFVEHNIEQCQLPLSFRLVIYNLDIYIQGLQQNLLTKCHKHLIRRLKFLSVPQLQTLSDENLFYLPS